MFRLLEKRVHQHAWRKEFKERTDKATDVADLLALVEASWIQHPSSPFAVFKWKEIVPFNMQHNAEVVLLSEHVTPVRFADDIYGPAHWLPRMPLIFFAKLTKCRRHSCMLR